MINPDDLIDFLKDPAASAEKLEEERKQAVRKVLMSDYSSVFALYAFTISTLDCSDSSVQGLLDSLPGTIVERRLMAEPELSGDENADCRALLESEAADMGVGFKSAVMNMRKRLGQERAELL
ncbi:MAG: hypothetical protein ACFB2W_00610 [Leptolyngbyaceae cyanobacterium]